MARLVERVMPVRANKICANKTADVNEHYIYAAFSARAVKFARKYQLGHGKNMYPWFNNVQP